MPNPREWFRRRRSAALGSAAEESDDPFSGDGILDLGRGAMLIHETTPPAEPKRPEIGERRDHVPPPPPRAAVARREGRMLDRSAFTIMPEIVRSGDAPRAGATVAPAHFSVHRGQRPHIAAAPRPATAEAKLVPPAREPADAARPAAPAPESEQAAFTIAAPGVAWKRTRSSLPAAGAQGALLREAFTPTRPKQSNAVFSGRFKQMQRIIAAIEEERAHVMVFGERGSGKTSLANVLASKAEEAGYVVLRFACSSELTFEDIFRGLLRRMPATLLADGIAATTRAGVDNLEQLLPGSCSVGDLIHIFERIHDKHVILIIDEYDRVTGEDTKAKLAELIKNMSDAALPVTLLIIGVAENVGQLLGKHPSLKRTLVAVPMPLMSPREIDAIIATGEEKSGLRFDPWVRRSITEFAQGLPYHAQLLGLMAARSAARRRSTTVERTDLHYAIERAAEEADSAVREAYDRAVGPHQNASFRDALFYAARCRTDEYGGFTAADVAAAAAEANAQGLSLLALQYPLKKLTEGDRGSVLRRTVGPGGLRYAFSSQMMRHHVLVRQAEQRGLI